MDPPCKYTKCKKEEINRGEAESDENQTVLIRTTNKQARKYVLLLVFSENMNKSGTQKLDKRKVGQTKVGQTKDGQTKVGQIFGILKKQNVQQDYIMFLGFIYYFLFFCILFFSFFILVFLIFLFFLVF